MDLGSLIDSEQLIDRYQQQLQQPLQTRTNIAKTEPRVQVVDDFLHDGNKIREFATALKKYKLLEKKLFIQEGDNLLWKKILLNCNSKLQTIKG